MSVIGALLKFITYLVAVIYVLLVIVAWADCSIIPGLGKSCVNPHGGYPEHGLYWMGVILYSPIGVPACLISLVLLWLKHLRRVPPLA